MTDPIADLLTRIRNGYGAHHDVVMVPHSNQKTKIAEVMVSKGYLESTETVEVDGFKQLKLTLKYVGRYPVISHLERISTPGRRIYTSANKVKPVLGGHGIRILSTSKGIMIDSEAKAQNLGGEVICKIW